VILIVEDNATSRDLLARALRLGGHDVRAAEDGRQALEILDRERPALIFVDLVMSGIDGWELQRILQDRPELSRIPLIVVSAVLDLEDRARQLNAKACLPKPVDLDDILRYAREYDR
jgi:CheY-like chemotaxis protein